MGLLQYLSIAIAIYKPKPDGDPSHHLNKFITPSLASKTCTMKLSTAILFAIGTDFTHVHADGELIASWVQFTGADMEKPSCADLIRNANSGQPPFESKASKVVGPGCFFTAEVRAIYNDTAMANPGCPDGVLKVNGDDTPMMVRVEAIEHFENFVSRIKVSAVMMMFLLCLRLRHAGMLCGFT
jgi:hypothetical protein